uniref:UPF0113 domain-containing protein n=1 Tax=Fervidicoccus fontis TaxID=683846 RepID=A0A7J3ZLL2_9CREN
MKRDVSGLIELVLRRSAVSGLRAPEHAGILLGTSVKGEIRLSLHLAYILATRASRGLFRPQQGVIAVNRHGERAFTFSKPVGISDYRVLGVSPTNTYLVLSEQGDPLGWGTLDPHKRLVPLIDSGWFLRAGW